MVYICSDNPEHSFKESELPEDTLLCPKCQDGLLVRSDTLDTLDTDHENELGLCVILMDASLSMTQNNIPPSNKNRLELIAETAAKGIFDLQGIAKAKDTYICAMGFSKEVRPLFLESAHTLFEKYNGDVDAFATFFKTELSKMPGDTNINGALQAAYGLVEKFLNKELIQGNYEVLYHALWTHANKDVDVPNVRVLLYTDGRHNVPNATDPIINPFQSMYPDILMGVFIGNESHEGCSKLKAALSNCPEHDHPQFFLLDRSEKLTTLRKIFHMASGTSGFCEKCQKQ